MQGEERIRRLQWLCRRGMRELDILLESFLTCKHDELSASAFPALECFLNEEDDRLWDWLQMSSRPESGEYRKLVDAIRRVA